MFMQATFDPRAAGSPPLQYGLGRESFYVLVAIADNSDKFWKQLGNPGTF